MVPIPPQYPGMSFGHHLLVDVRPKRVMVVLHVERAEGSSIAILPMFLDSHRLTPDQFDKTCCRYLAPWLPVLGTIDCVESDGNPSPALLHDHGITVDDVVDLDRRQLCDVGLPVMTSRFMEVICPFAITL